MGDYFLFGLVFIKKSNQTEIFLKKKTKPIQIDRFQFGSVFLDKNRFKPVLLGFFGFAWFFRFGSVFFRFFSVWIRFGFFSFRLIKPKPNRTGRFFQNFNRFFFTVRFF